MASIFVDLDETYNIQDPTSTVSIQVTIGDGQDGAYVIFLNSSFKGTNQKTKLGTGAAIKGLKTLVSVTITDELEETNWTSFSVTIFENNKSTSVLGPYKKQAPSHMDTIVYTLNIFNS
jgi:hypothetical protein